MVAKIQEACALLAAEAHQLRGRWHFEWAEMVRHAAARLALPAKQLPPLAAIVGGASSGKSTLFNNLLGGRLASMVTARGHATLGPILAVHEANRHALDDLISLGEPTPDGDASQARTTTFFPGYRVRHIAAEENAAGAPDVLTILIHTHDPLRDVLLCDTPDFTSDAAEKEGDVTLSLLPWFDRLLVVVDHERWFDRQSISRLREQSARLGQSRMVLFNRTQEEALADADRESLALQAQRLGAEGMTVLEFRRGRGLCIFAPGTLSEVETFVNAGPVPREPALLRVVGESAQRALNQNDERAARLKELEASLSALAQRLPPSEWECMTALMTVEERAHLDVVARVLRLRQTGRWLSQKTDRVRRALGQVPMLGVLFESREKPGEVESTTTDRALLADRFAEHFARRAHAETQRIVHASAFWDEMHRWTGMNPRDHAFVADEALRARSRAAGESFDRAMVAWTARVESEYGGLGTGVRGAVSVGAVSLAVVLIAVPGPLAALTLLSAKAAVVAALSHLATAAGAGALLGGPIERLAAVATEKLLGSPEYDAVRREACAFHEVLAAHAHTLSGEARRDAAALVLPAADPLTRALTTVSAAWEKRS